MKLIRVLGGDRPALIRRDLENADVFRRGTYLQFVGCRIDHVALAADPSGVSVGGQASFNRPAVPGTARVETRKRYGVAVGRWPRGAVRTPARFIAVAFAVLPRLQAQ